MMQEAVRRVAKEVMLWIVTSVASFVLAAVVASWLVTRFWTAREPPVGSPSASVAR